MCVCVCVCCDRYNLLVVERLSHDISALQNFAARVCVRDSQVKDPVMSGMHTQFAEPEQLFRLLLSGQVRDKRTRTHTHTLCTRTLSCSMACIDTRVGMKQAETATPGK